MMGNAGNEWNIDSSHAYQNEDASERGPGLMRDLDALEKNIAILGELSGALERHIEPILTPQTEINTNVESGMAPNVKGKDTDEPSKVRRRIQQLSSMLEQQSRRIEKLMRQAQI